MSSDTHTIISPAIMYWGTPVVLVTTENEDGTSNITPISSAWWLAHTCLLGFGAECKALPNILRTKECVINLPSDSMAHYVNKLADTTGLPPSEAKASRNYKFVKDKWTKAGLHPQPSSFVAPSRIAECPVQMEGKVAEIHKMMGDMPDLAGATVAVEVRVLRTHVLEDLRMEGHANRIDPDKWRPLIMSFQEFYGLRDGKVVPSVLGRVNEEKYRGLTKSEVKKLPGDEDDQIAGVKESE